MSEDRLLEYTHSLCELLQHDLLRISAELYARKLLPKAEHDFQLNALGLPNYHKAARLVSCVSDLIRHSPDKFNVFIDVLKRESYFADIVREITSSKGSSVAMVLPRIKKMKHHHILSSLSQHIVPSISYSRKDHAGRMKEIVLSQECKKLKKQNRWLRKQLKMQRLPKFPLVTQPKSVTCMSATLQILKCSKCTHGLQQVEYEKRLLVLCGTGDIGEFIYLLNQPGINPNIHDKDGNTLLWLTSYYGRTVAVVGVLFITHDVKVNQPNNNEWGDTALIAACVQGHEIIVAVLIKQGAAVDYQNEYGQHSLYGASFTGKAGVVDYLLHHGVTVDLPANDELQFTALSVACQEGHTDVSDILIEGGANVDYQDGIGQHSLWKASYDGQLEIVELLLKHKAQVDLPTDDDIGSRPLDAACQKGHTEVASMLIENGAPVNSQNKKGHHCLYIASYFGYIKIVKLLVHHRADINLPTNDDLGLTALSVSCQEGHLDVSCFLLEHGATVDYYNKVGVTSLFMASQEGYDDIVQLLLDCGASVDLPTMDEDQYTALIIACCNGHTKVVVILIQRGASLNYRSKDGWSALLVAAHVGLANIVKSLIGSGAELDITNEEGRTALTLASWKGHTDTVTMLLHSGSDPNVQDQEGLTPLMMATQVGHKDVVKALLKAGANPNTVSKTCGWSALFFAAKAGDMDIVKLLVECGAYVELKDKNGLTALDIADCKDICNFLQNHMNIKEREITEDQKKQVMKSYQRLLRILDLLEEKLLPSRAMKRKRTEQIQTESN